MGIVITCATLIVCTICSPVTSNINGNISLSKYLSLGNLKDVVLTYIGFVFFDDASFTLMVGFGLLLSFLGAGKFVYDSYKKEAAFKSKI